VLACALSIAAACWSNPIEPIPDTESVYDVLPEVARPEFDAARQSLDAGRPEAALPKLADLARKFPDNIVVGIWLQEAEIATSRARAPQSTPNAAPNASSNAQPNAQPNAQLSAQLSALQTAQPTGQQTGQQGAPSTASTSAAPTASTNAPTNTSTSAPANASANAPPATPIALPSTTAPGPLPPGSERATSAVASDKSAFPAGAVRDSALDELRQRYRRAAEEKPTVAHLVLAARLESDEPAAVLLLDRAQAIDPRCAWIHYARAWFAARANRWPDVKAEIASAKEADPGHMPTRWLDAWMLSRGGDLHEAIPALEAWLDKARGDTRLDPRMVREAELDLALLSILDGDPKRARDILEQLRDTEVDPGRKWGALAPTEQALDREREALAAAQRAEQLDPGEILPVVQQAILYESWLGDADAAEAAWTRALALARSSSDLGALLERVRARVHVERLRGEREKKNAKRSG
jgi:predicted Zn-dependent protease